MTRLLIVGATGQVGAELRRAQLPMGWTIEAPGRNDIDLASPKRIAEAIAALKPDLVINAAAYTAVDRAESDSELAFAINRDGAAALALAAAACGAALAHVSTDYVFDGEASAPYAEDHPKSPLGVYGRSKSEGEEAVLHAHKRAAVIRSSWVFSAHRTNFLKTMLRLGETREEVGIVADQIGRPTAATDLAVACLHIGARLLEGDTHAAGVFHFANAGDATWADFAEAIFKGAARRGRRPVHVRRIATADYPTLARRPANSRLETKKVETLFGIHPRPWHAALDECLDELIAR